MEKEKQIEEMRDTLANINETNGIHILGYYPLAEELVKKFEEIKSFEFESEFARGFDSALILVSNILKNLPSADVVPRSEVEKLQKKLDDYERVVGKLSFTVDGVATLLIGENVEYIEKDLANGFKNMAVKQAKQEVAREIFAEIEKNPVVMQSCIFIDKKEYAELKKKYIGE